MMGDLISRSRMMDSLNREDTRLIGGNHYIRLSAVEEKIRIAPTVDAVEVVHGHWIRCDGKSIVWYCSECGGKILYNPNPRTYNIKKPKVEQYNKFCRNCGTKMDGGADDEKS